MAGKGNKWLLIYQMLKHACNMCLEIRLNSHPKHRPFVWSDMYVWDAVWDFYYTAPMYVEQFKDDEIPSNYGKAKNKMTQHLHSSSSNSDKIEQIYRNLLNIKVEEGLISKTIFYDWSRSRKYKTPNGGTIEHNIPYYYFKEFTGFPKKARVYKTMVITCIDCAASVEAKTSNKLRCDDCNKAAAAKEQRRKYKKEWAKLRDNPIKITIRDIVVAYNLHVGLSPTNDLPHKEWVNKKDIIQHVRHTFGCSVSTIYKVYRKYPNMFEEKKVGISTFIRRK